MPDLLYKFFCLTRCFHQCFFGENSLVISFGFMGSPASPATPIPCMHYAGFFLISDTDLGGISSWDRSLVWDASPNYLLSGSLMLFWSLVKDDDSPRIPALSGALYWESLYHGLTFQLCGVWSNSPKSTLCASKTQDCVFSSLFFSYIH